MARRTVILRLARTLPRLDAPGVGLHCYYYSNLSPRPTVVITKKSSSPAMPLRDHVLLHEVPYSDRTTHCERISLIDILLIGATKIYGDLLFLVSTLRFLRRHGLAPAVIHVHSANYLITGLVVKRLYRAPLCLNFGGSELVRARKLGLYRWMFRRLDTAFYVARSMEADLHRYLPPDKCVYTANGIDHSLFYSEANPARGADIVAVGNLRWQKDYATMIQAFSRIAPSRPALTLSIFGDGVLGPSLKELCEANGVGDRVIFKGTQSQGVLRTALQRCCAYVISSRQEGFPKSLIEAMACGAPVVATDAGECRQTLAGICDVVPPGDVEGLAAALAAVVDNGEHQRALSERCLSRSRDFSWERISAVVEARYNQLTGA